MYPVSKYKSTTAFQDLLFNMLIGFVFLFVVALLMINPITKKSDAPKKAEYLITMTWDSHSRNDLDMWIRSPSGKIASFQNKNAGLLHLERDDLGLRNDTSNGIEIFINEETVTLRGIEAGEYEVMLHIYRLRKVDEDASVQVQLVQINPYGVRYNMEVTYTKTGQVISLFRFTVDKEGKFIGISNLPSNFIPIRQATGSNGL